MHAENTIFLPRTAHDACDVLFDIPIRAVAGKPIVCMVPKDDRWGSLVLPDEVQGRYQPDVGVVADPAGVDGLERGQFVALKPYTGAWFGDRDFDWVPQGREFRILGTVDAAENNVLAILS